MDAQLSDQRRYRPLYKTLTVGTNQYAVVDRDVAYHRADRYYNQALDLIDISRRQAQNQSALDPALVDQIADALLLATDLGSGEAPMLLAQRALDGLGAQHVLREDVIVFLRIAAERQHAEAAYRLGCSYAATGNFTEIEALITADPHLTPQERYRLAIHYLMLAVEQQHAIAIETLILAYAYGRPYIPKDASQFVSLCTRLVRRGNQSVALGFGAWLAGMTVEGKPPLADSIQLTSNPELSLRYLLMASRGSDLQLAQHALHLLSLGVQRGVWGNELTNSAMKRTMIEDALTGNQLLALYLTWYSLDAAKRPNLPDLIASYACESLEKVFAPCVQRAVHYFELTVKGAQSEIASAARSLSRHVFAGYVDALNTLKAK